MSCICSPPTAFMFSRHGFVEGITGFAEGISETMARTPCIRYIHLAAPFLARSADNATLSATPSVVEFAVA